MEVADIGVGFSSCPNDTFVFHGLVHGAVAPELAGGLSPVIEDIEALNDRAAGPAARRLPFTKLSVGALPELLDDYAVLDVGAALGRGVGPLIVGRRGRGGLANLADVGGRKVAIPGLRTTAYRLLQAFAPACTPVPMRFDRIMDAVASGACDAGVVIHEGRFTYEAAGLTCVADLGQLWEQATQMPLPLGVIAVGRWVPPDLAHAFAVGLRASVEFAWANPALSRPWIRAHAQELDDAVIDQHIDLYVNAFTRELGAAGRRAIEELLARCGANVARLRFAAPEQGPGAAGPSLPPPR